MRVENLIHTISGLLLTGSSLAIVVFVNLILRKRDIQISGFGISMPTEQVYIIFGPMILLINSTLFIFLCALYKHDLNQEEMAIVTSYQPIPLTGPLFNPFFISANIYINSMGYAFLIVLWWIAMHSFWYSIDLNTGTPFVFAYRWFITCLFLALGLMSMLAIQQCWYKFGFDDFKIKWVCGFIGIPIGGFLLPFLLKLGAPTFLKWQ
jgi:hypothetical protein